MVCLLLLRSTGPLPLKNVANKIAKNETTPKLIENFFKSLKINPDVLSLMTDINLILDRDVVNSDREGVFSGINLRVSEIYENLPRIKVQYLADLGKDIACAQEKKDQNRVKVLIFLGFLASKNLPGFFRDVIQNKSFTNKEIELNRLREVTGMKKPDAKHLIEWCRWLDLNISKRGSLLLDRYEIIYKLTDSLVYLLNKELEENKLFGKSIYFYQIRYKISKILGLNEGFVGFDKLFKIILTSNEDKISFAPARDALLEGKGFEGQTRFAIFSIDSDLEYSSKEECIRWSDANALLVG